ncbi:hypothetical protein Pla100_57520 [Neorhodopirellula pilleata]|uniref:Uncharacterized protein n=1 Tax=Neorhodopirellula pilleata TaxID=2714738 RepID=A0A5C5ZMD8_9BACT|nr:hypothetical protein Pla100_57520 [Neorhodopirellula pilleata]
MRRRTVVGKMIEAKGQTKRSHYMARSRGLACLSGRRLIWGNVIGWYSLPTGIHYYRT